ncbi:hypothetical protein OIO90_002783 [Microbotryomycetes sp. JL221]|nr:hypothetical protein OIO90_002783 [Microbotryomycetes sp. JL221]
MPFISLPGGISLFVEVFRANEPLIDSSSSSTSTVDGTANALAACTLQSGSSQGQQQQIDLSHPTLVVFSRFLGDITSREPVVQDPRVRSRFNVVCIDLRHQGRSKCPVRPEYDSSVGAADVAFVMEALALPPAWVYAATFTAWPVAVKLSVLFPDQVAGLIGAGITGMYAPPANLQLFRDLDVSWLTPVDEDDYEEALTGFAFCMFAEPKDVDPAIVDDNIGVLTRRYGPNKATAAYGVSHSCHYSPRLSPEFVGALRQPVLVMVGDRDPAFLLREAQESLDAFTSSTSKRLVIIPEGGHLIAANHGSTIVENLLDFTEAHVSNQQQPQQFVQFHFHRALRIVAQLAGDQRILRRNVSRPESYTMLSEDEINEATSAIQRLQDYQVKCTIRFPGSDEPETWDLESSLVGRRRRRWRYSTRHQYTPMRPESLRRSVTDSITIAVERARAEEYDDSESCGSTSVPSTPTSLSPIDPALHGSKEKDPSKRASVPFQLYQIRI